MLNFCMQFADNTVFYDFWSFAHREPYWRKHCGSFWEMGERGMLKPGSKGWGTTTEKYCDSLIYEKKSAIRKYGKERTVTRSIRYKPGNAEYFWLAFRQESHFLFLSLLASLRGSSTIRKNKQSKNTEGWEHETKKGLFVWSVYHVRCLADWF